MRIVGEGLLVMKCFLLLMPGCHHPDAMRGHKFPDLLCWLSLVCWLSTCGAHVTQA